MARTARQSRRLKKAFLEHFAEFGNITAGARHVGIDRNTVYWWQEHDEAFAVAFRDAEIQSIEVLEAEARRRGVEGVVTITPSYYKGKLLSETIETKYSDTLLIFLLKARAPEKYRERIGVEHSGTIDTNGSDLDMRIAARLAEMASRGESPSELANPRQAESTNS